MSDLIVGLFIFGGVLLIIAVVGHGLWVAFSWFIRLLFGARDVARAVWNCPQCGRKLSANDYGCVACGWGHPRGAQLAARSADLQAAARQLQRFRDSGAIAPETYERVMAAIEAEEQLARPSTSEAAAARAPAGAQPILLPPLAETVSGADMPGTRAMSLDDYSPVDPLRSPVAPTSHATPDVSHALPIVPPRPGTTDAYALVPGPVPPGAGTTPSPAQRTTSFGEPIQPSPALPPRKALSEVLAAFMEERNIRWGELVGGVLIIGCSIMLVVSQWSTINAIPILKYFLFTAVTSTLFGVGLYTEHRWKLPTTSRGLLIIASLLVPLNFLVIGAFSKGMSPWNPQSLASELVALVAFLYLTHRAGRVIVPDWPWILTLGVLGPCAAQLIIRRFADGAGTALLFAFGALPLLCYGAATAGMLRELLGRKNVGEADSNALFILLGSVSFAALLAFGFLIHGSGRPMQALRDLAPLVSVGGVPALASGLMLWRQLAEAKLASLRMAATSIAVAGAAALIGGVVLAWPRPAGMLPGALLDFVALTAIALLCELPAAHLLATPCLLLAYLITFHLFQGRVQWLSGAGDMWQAMLSASSGSGLAAMVLLFGAGSEVWRRFGRVRDAAFYRVATGATVLASLALVTAYGFGRTGDPHGATFVYALYALVVLAGAWRIGLWQLAWAGSALLLAAIVQAVVFRFAEAPDAYHCQLAMLLHATAAVLAALAARRFGPSIRRLFADPMSFSAVASSWLAVPFWLFAAPQESTAVLAAFTFWLAAVWFGLSFLHRLAGLFTAAQLMLTLGVLFAVTAWMKTLHWYATLPVAAFDPWVLQVQGIALVLLSLAWVGVRVVFRVQGLGFSECPREDVALAVAVRPASETLRWLLYPPWPPIDRMVTGAVLFGFVAMAAYAVVPGILREMAPRATSDLQVWSIAGISHTHALSGQAWVLWLMLIALLVARLWERFEQWLVHGIILTLASGCPLVAAMWDADGATASALRWAAGAFLLLASLPIWLRTHVYRLSEPMGWPAMPDRVAGLARDARVLLLIVTVAPVLTLTVYPAITTIAGSPTMLVAPESVFGRMGDAISYVVPLAFVFIALVGHAVRERSASLAFSGGLVLNLAVTLGYLLGVIKSGGVISDAVTHVRLLQLNAVAAASFALAWLSSRGWLLRKFTGAQPEPAGNLLRLQVAIGIAVNLPLLVPADLWLFVSPTTIDAAMVERGSLLGWLALGTTMAAAAALQGMSTGVKFRAGAIFACLLGVGSLIACGLCNWDAGYFTASPPALGIRQSIPWLGFHTLAGSRVVAGWLILAMGWFTCMAAAHGMGAESRTGMVQTWPSAIRRWATVAVLLAVVMALRNAVDARDLTRPWWPAGVLVASSVLLAALARWAFVPGYLYGAGLVGNLAATSWCIVELWPASGHILDTIHVNVMALALPAVAWLAMELHVFRGAPVSQRRRLPAFHHVAAIGSLAIMFLVVALGLYGDAIERPITGAIGSLAWAALISVGVIVAACFWDSAAVYSMPALYVVGLIGVGMTVDGYDLRAHWLGWTAVIILAAYSIATSYLWSQRDRLRAFGGALGIARRDDSPYAGQTWLLIANQVLAVGVVVLSYWIVLTYGTETLGTSVARAFSLRLTAAKAAMAQALAIGLLARGSRRPQLQRVSLWLVAIGAVAWGWAWLDPLTAGNLLNRAVFVLTVLAAMTAFYGIGLSKVLRRENEWARAAQDLMPWLAALCAGSLILILGIEVADQVRIGRVEMSGLAILVVALALTGLSVSCVVLAVVPGRDPFQLTERGRMFYVYAAEALLGLLFMHIRLAKSEWFHGFFEQFWPLVVLAIAYVGVALAEIFRRQRRLVLAEPLERTGTLLPVLPVLGFWAMQSETHYSLILVLVGLMYATLSVTRKSFGLGVLASLAANGGLVYLLNHDLQYQIFEHAQFWLIPLALCVLAAAYLNRDQLAPDQFAAIRYITVMIIYVSSTADIFLTGVRAAPWLPMVLAVLSVAGIFGGIMLRVRAFLFLGSSFLVLSLVTMILSAHINLQWTWLWWVAGISLGVTILVVFALFEKKRHEMLDVVEQIRQWD